MTDETELKENRTRSVKTTPRQDIMIDELLAKHGLSTFAALFGMALSHFHIKSFPDYIVNRGKVDPALSVESVAKQKVAKDEATDQAKNDALIKKKQPILDQLEGVVKEMGGELVAIYYTHTLHSDDRQILPLRQISEDLIPNQYAPSKRMVERIRKEKGRKIVKKDGDEIPE